MEREGPDSVEPWAEPVTGWGGEGNVSLVINGCPARAVPAVFTGWKTDKVAGAGFKAVPGSLVEQASRLNQHQVKGGNPIFVLRIVLEMPAAGQINDG